MNEASPRLWVEVDLSAVAHNVHALRNFCGAGVHLMPLVKADAYGCGAVAVGAVAIDHGADWLGVELVEEAIPLRNAGIRVPILVSGPCGPDEAEAVAAYRLRPTVRDVSTVESLESHARALGRRVSVHVEMETGLNRLGVCEEEVLAIVRRIQACKFVRFEGLWTHFAESDEEDPTFTKRQFSKYLSFVQRLADMGIPVSMRHVANSAALLRFPEMRLDMVRVGESIYGYLPKPSLANWVALWPAVTWKSRVIQTRSLGLGESVGYGRSWVAARPSLIGTIPVGYADGYRRALSNRSSVLVRGEKVPIVGRVSMHMITADLTDIAGATVGDEVVLMGQQGEAQVTAYDLAAWADTAEFEILVGISPKIPRIYVGQRPELS